jgi:hypothetical protein
MLGAGPVPRTGGRAAQQSSASPRSTRSAGCRPRQTLQGTRRSGPPTDATQEPARVPQLSRQGWPDRTDVTEGGAKVCVCVLWSVSSHTRGKRVVAAAHPALMQDCQGVVVWIVPADRWEPLQIETLSPAVTAQRSAQKHRRRQAAAASPAPYHRRRLCVASMSRSGPAGCASRTVRFPPSLLLAARPPVACCWRCAEAAWATATAARAASGSLTRTTKDRSVKRASPPSSRAERSRLARGENQWPLLLAVWPGFGRCCIRWRMHSWRCGELGYRRPSVCGISLW